MRYRKSTSVSLDETTQMDAAVWAKKEHLQLSSYIEEAVEMRNRWHQRNEEKEVKNEPSNKGRSEKKSYWKNSPRKRKRAKRTRT